MAEAGGSGGNDAFIRWLTTIIEEIDSTADTLKDEANTVKVRKITPNLEILRNALRAGNGRARKNAVIGLDDAIATAIKYLQGLRTNLKEEARQLFNVPVDRMEASQMFFPTQAMMPGASATASKSLDATKSSSDLQNRIIRSCSSSLEFSGGGRETGRHLALSRNGVANCEDETFGGSGSKKTTATGIGKIGGESGGGRSEVQVIIPPGDPVPEPLAGCSSHVDLSEGRIITKQQKKTDEVVDISRRHSLSPSLSGVPSRKDKDPKDLLSAECWTHVFDTLEEPQDWLNLYRTSSYFQDVVGDKRTTALFPQVLTHVTPYLGKKNLPEILGLRLVCRPWKTAVENLLETLATTTDSPGVHVRWQLQDSYKFENPARISTFLDQYETHAGNPFVGRLALLTYNFRRRSRVGEEYSILASQLLEKFGKHLRTLRVDIDHTSFDNVGTRLGGCLQLVPNLESLVVCCCSGVGQLSSCIAKELLPLLPKLKSISFFCMGMDADADRASILGLQNAVVRLTCNPNSLKSVSTVGFPSALQDFPNLKSADVRLYGAEDCSNLPSTPWPLSKLTLRHFFDDKRGVLFSCVENFKATLTSLCFVFLFDPVVNLKLDLPHLKKLTIEAELSLSLEYFTNLANLEVLCIDHSPYDSNNRTTTLQKLIGYVEAEVVRCRLWESLPRLTKICLSGASWDQITNGTHEVRHVATRRSREFKWDEDENRRF